jgi:hypothetical protein
MIVWKTSEVGRIVQHAFGFSSNIAREKCSNALQTRTAGSSGLKLPVYPGEVAVFKSNIDSAIDNGDEVGIGKVIQDASWTWTINAGKDYVAIKRGAVAGLLRQTVWHTSHITGIQNLVTLGVWLLIAAGIGGIGWALINGMRRQAWGAQLIFGAACLGFGGIVALWNEYANGRSAVLPAF